MRRTLFINTATQQTSITLFEEDEMVAARRWLAHFDEAQKLQPAVDELLTQRELTPDGIDRLVCCIGPGGFTSTRIGVSATNAWAFAKGLPSAPVTVFDLYAFPSGESEIPQLLFLTTNKEETWLKAKGMEAQFFQRADLRLPSSFQFGGIVDQPWRAYLEEHGGQFVALEEKPPDLRQLRFSHQMLKPWYYKDAKITWSKKIGTPPVPLHA